MPIKLTANNGNIDLKVPIKQLGGAVDSVNGMTGDVVLTANDVDAIDKYNGMTPVECVFPPQFDGGSEISKTLYVKQGVINPVDYKTVTDDIKTAWRNLTFLTDATVGKLSSYQSNIKSIAPLIEIGVFGEDFFNTVTYNSPCVFFDDPITQRKKITIYTYNASKKSFSVIIDGPNGFYATDAYSILNDEFSGGRVYDQHLRPYSNNANDTASKLGQLEMAAAPTKDMQIATKKYVDDSVSNPLNITSATVGQIAKITAVDDSGKPTAWEAVDMPTVPNDYELVFQETVAEDVGAYSRDTDKDGNPFSLTDVMVIIFTKPFAESTNSAGRALGFLPTSKWGHYTVSCEIGSSISSENTNSVGRYNVVFVKVVNGYQVVTRAYESQNTTNVFGILMRQTKAGNEMFRFHTDATKLMQLDTPQGNITCVKIVGYTNPLVSAGTIVALYKKKGT